MATVHDVAAYILSRVDGRISTMKLQKLCYYSQGWSLAWDERPLFNARIEAWANGPVITELYREHRGNFSVTEWPKGDASALSENEVETIEAVLDGYQHLTGQQLSDLTHAERPWLTARNGIPNGARCQDEVSLDTMQDFFGGLMASETVATEL
ncbi:hypothetical protein CGQ24_07455 [Arthrobacter sp. 7749]|nr:hypothetical protein CGQ24_07455 [Arthrobacter sp. 7749]